MVQYINCLINVWASPVHVQHFYFIFAILCVCACVRACVRVCVCVWGGMCDCDQRQYCKHECSLYHYSLLRAASYMGEESFLSQWIWCCCFVCLLLLFTITTITIHILIVCAILWVEGKSWCLDWMVVARRELLWLVRMNIMSSREAVIGPNGRLCASFHQWGVEARHQPEEPASGGAPGGEREAGPWPRPESARGPCPQEGNLATRTICNCVCRCSDRFHASHQQPLWWIVYPGGDGVF